MYSFHLHYPIIEIVTAFIIVHIFARLLLFGLMRHADLYEFNAVSRVDNETRLLQKSVSENAQCSYCGRYGILGLCQGCGAPNNIAILHQ